MPSSSTRRTRLHKLPASIRRTQGPTNADDNECPICHEPAESNSEILTHEGCGCWFDHECLQSWLDSQGAPTCPWCRSDLENLWDLDPHDRFHRVAEGLEDLEDSRGPPDEHHVRRTGSQAVDVLHAAAPEMPRTDLERLVTDAIELAMDAIDFMFEDMYDSHFYPLEDGSELYGRRDEFKFDVVSLRHLWTAERILGFDDFFLLRLPAVPRIGIWLPRTSDHRIQVHCCLPCLERSAQPEVLHEIIADYPTSILTVPLSTDFLCDRLLPINRVRGSIRQVDHLTTLALELSVTHWCLVDLRDADLAMGIHAIPWPRDKLQRGFKSLKYPWPSNIKHYDDSFWNAEVESTMQRRFVAQHALMPDHASYLLSRSEGEEIILEVGECRQKLENIYNIKLDEDLRFEEDEVWHPWRWSSEDDNEESSSGSEDDEDEDADEESSEDSSEDDIPPFEHPAPERLSARSSTCW